MREGVIRDRVTAGEYLCDQVRELFRFRANHKERRTRSKALQRVEHLQRVVR